MPISTVYAKGDFFNQNKFLSVKVLTLHSCLEYDKVKLYEMLLKGDCESGH